MNILASRETVENLAKAHRMRWHRHVLKRDKVDALRNVLSFILEGQRKWERPWKTRKRQVEEEIRRTVL